MNILSLESNGNDCVLTVAINNTTTHSDMFAEYEAADGLIKLFGVLYSKTGWDSDRKIIYYKGPEL